jgi:hypothetical protein
VIAMLLSLLQPAAPSSRLSFWNRRRFDGAKIRLLDCHSLWRRWEQCNTIMQRGMALSCSQVKLAEIKTTQSKTVAMSVDYASSWAMGFWYLET